MPVIQIHSVPDQRKELEIEIKSVGGHQGQLGPAYPRNSKTHINPSGELPTPGRGGRGQGQGR